MKIPTEVRLCWDFFRGCSCLNCTNRAEMHHLLCWCSRDCCTPWKCTNRAEMHRLLCWCSRDCCTPWKCTNRASTAPTELTIRGYVGVRGYGRDAIPSYNCSP